jgi:hypothetical protein
MTEMIGGKARQGSTISAEETSTGMRRTQETTTPHWPLQSVTATRSANQLPTWQLLSSSLLSSLLLSWPITYANTDLEPFMLIQAATQSDTFTKHINIPQLYWKHILDVHIGRICAVVVLWLLLACAHQ